MTQALTDVQAQHRQMVRAIAGTSMVGSPVRLDGERTDADLPPPTLGEHSDEILGAIGVAQVEIERLKAAGVVG
jgi:crotonobetainyl-CoA:carnitine CoA-transferase CaiB-like acyl-CoA transferase